MGDFYDLRVNDFKHIPGKNDAEYIKLLEDALKGQQEVIAKAIARIKELSKMKKDGDLISREAVISSAVDLQEMDSERNVYTHKVIYADDVAKLSSAAPEKTGYWIVNYFSDGKPYFTCSRCQCICTNNPPPNYCEDCGSYNDDWEVSK